MDQVLRIQPPQIVFSVRPGHLSTFTAEFTNLYHTPIAYNVRTTVPKRYCVQVNKAILQPGESRTLLFSQQPYEIFPEPLVCKDRFQVLVRKLDTPQLLHLSLPEVWHTTSVFDYERKFRVKLLLSDQPPSIPFDFQDQPAHFDEYPDIAPHLPAPPSGLLEENDRDPPPPPSPPPPPLPPTPSPASPHDISLSTPLHTNPIQIPDAGKTESAESLEPPVELISVPFVADSSNFRLDERHSDTEVSAHAAELPVQHPLGEEDVVEIVETPPLPAFYRNEQLRTVQVPPVTLLEERAAVGPAVNSYFQITKEKQDAEAALPVIQENGSPANPVPVSDIRTYENPSFSKRTLQSEVYTYPQSDILSSNAEAEMAGDRGYVKPLAATIEDSSVKGSELTSVANADSESQEEREEKERRMEAERMRVAELLEKKNEEEEKKRAIEEKRLAEELERVAEEEEKKRKEDEKKRAIEKERLRVEEEARLAREVELEKQRTRAEVLRGRAAPAVEFAGMSDEQEHRAAVDRCAALYRMISEREKEMRKLSLELREAKHMLSSARLGVGPLHELTYEPDTRFPISQVALMAAISGALLTFFL